MLKRVFLFDIGSVLLTPRDPYRVWRALVPDEAALAETLARLRFTEWNDVWDTSTFADCVAQMLARYPQDAELIRAFAARWIRVPWGRPMAGTVQIVRSLRRRGHRLFLASNWPADDFERARSKMTFLPLFDGYQVSGHVGLIKPSAAYFRRMMTTFAFDPEDAVFIDDVPCNVEGAQAVGIDGILFKNAARLRADLSARGLLPCGRA